MEREKAEMRNVTDWFHSKTPNGQGRLAFKKLPDLFVWIVTPEQANRIRRQARIADSNVRNLWAECADENLYILGADSRGRRKRIPWILINALPGRIRFSLHEPVRGFIIHPETRKRVADAAQKMLENLFALQSRSIIASEEVRSRPRSASPRQCSIEKADLMFTDDSAGIELHIPGASGPISPGTWEKLQKEIRGCVGAFVALVFEAMQAAIELGIQRPADIVRLALYEENRKQGMRKSN
jgi:hypothetical protein